MSDNNTNPTINKQGRDGFFVVSMSAWENLFNGAMKDTNETETVRVMAAYLALCCGSGGDHKTTSWSAGSIRKYAGISQRPSERAIKLLELYGCIDTVKKAEKNKLPIYKINFFDNNPKEQSTDNIFVPNGVVTGVAGEDSPLKRLTKYQDPYVLYLFIRLYGFQDKYLDAIEPNIISTAISENSKLDAIEIYNDSGLFKIWALENDPSISGYFVSGFYDFKKYYEENDNKRFYYERTKQDNIFGLLDILGGLNLMSTVTYACNGDRAHSADEIDFICETNNGTQQTTFNMLSERAEKKNLYINDDLDSYAHKVALPSSYRKVHFQTLYQLRYRTKLGEARNRYSDERALYQTMLKNLKSLEGK